MKIVTAMLAGAVLAIISGSARAETPAISFGGAYVGISAGTACGSSHYTTDPGCPDPSVDAVFCNRDATIVNGTAVGDSGRGDISSLGFIGGAQAGYNWQKNDIVFGGEADFTALDLGQSSTVTGIFPSPFAGTAYTLRHTMSTDWLGTIRGRVGKTVTPRVLVYATGGIAFTDVKLTSKYRDNATVGNPGGTGFGKKSNVRTGWTLGGGGEWLLGGHWSAKAEYIYTDFGTVGFDVPATNGPTYAQTMRANADFQSHIARVGLNYRF